MKKEIKLILFFLCCVLNTFAQAQTGGVSGKVTDQNGVPIAGVSVYTSDTKNGAVTDFDGEFVINDLEYKSYQIVFSYLGYSKQTITVTIPQTELLTIVLIEDTSQLDEVIITGVFDPRSKMESSVAISTIGVKQIDKIAITSSADLLKNVPGVYVNNSLGEIRNTVYSRGVSVGSNDGQSGYYYVSMQEDGLPVTNATFGNYGPDYFLRTDATLGRLEAVRGGTASILGNNAPGGIFNYVSKTGGADFEGEIRGKFGLEGNGKNLFYRTDFNVGGPLSKDKSLTFNIGGFYREAKGPNYPGYLMNDGGQIRANFSKSYKSGSIRLYLKYLDDKNGSNEFLPTVGFSDPHFAPGVTSTTSVLIPRVKETFTINDTGKRVNYDSANKIHSKDKSIGLNWDQNLGEGWNFDNKFRYSDKSSVWNTTGVVYPFAVDDLIWHAVSGNLFNFGTYSFNDHATGTQIGSVTSAPILIDGNFAGFDYQTNYSNFPGAGIQANSLYFNPLFYSENEMKEVIDQFTVSKKFNDMSFTAGLFYANSILDRWDAREAGVSYSQMTSPRPQLTDISFQGLYDGQTYYVTNPNGIAGGSGSSIPVNYIDAKQNQIAFFLGHNWEINSKLNLDWGIRYETVTFSGSNQISEIIDSTTGGTDGNPYTLYDNRSGIIGNTYRYSDQKINTFSYSAGLNYKFTDNQALYVRYSKGEKAPDMEMFVNINTQLALDNLNPIAQDVQQWEVGYKLKSGNSDLTATPFYSLLSNVPLQVTAQETEEISSSYLTPVLYNKYRTYGIEIEGNHQFTDKFGVRVVATFQDAKATEFKTWDIGENGSDDDTIIDFSGNKTDNSANVILRVSPSYVSGKFYSSLDFSYMGKRAANVANAFYLPAFNQSNLNVGYNITPNIQLQANINNIFNQLGVMGWSAPGGFPAALDRQGFTKEDLDANPNAVYSTVNLPPRSYFLTLTYKF
ncbi:TonB-dependent receptor domain-containing protein [Formosa sp. S-31]|uniref:TonB-dependent receptor n=1 Tax=Formosa sp. S-31 TaxID=2790949 RepID=UPI003EBD34EC